MCKEDFKIHFCTCSNKEVSEIDSLDMDDVFYNKRLASQLAFFKNDGSYYNTYFKWTLSSFVEESFLVLGSVVYPEDKLNEYLTSENILKELNTHNCFDFQYTPKERDILEIREEYHFMELKEKSRPHSVDHMSFKFENNKWVSGDYPLGYLHEKIETGKVEILKKDK